MELEQDLGTGNGAAQVAAPKKHVAIIYLGERRYEVVPLTLGKSQAWRKEFNVPVGELVAAIQQLPEVELTDLAALGQLVSTLQGTLLGSMEMVFDLLCKYSPEVAADKKYILENATDDQVMLAFVEVLKLAFPFGRLAGLILPSR